MVECNEVVGDLAALGGVAAEDVRMAGFVEDEGKFLDGNKGQLGCVCLDSSLAPALWGSYPTKIVGVLHRDLAP